MPAIQVILFDLGGTLLHYEQPPDFTLEQLNLRALQAMIAAATAAGARIADPEKAVRAVGRMAAVMEAKAKRTHYSNTAENIIQEGLEAVGIKLPARAWDAGLAAYYQTISAAVTLADPDVPGVLVRLIDQGRTLGLVSNTWWAPAMHDADLARFGLLELFPVRVYSCAAGIVKPHQAIYRLALDASDVAPAEAIFVGDRLAVDVAGPQKIGMRAVLVASPFRVEQDPEIQPDARIESIGKLPALVDEWERDLEIHVPNTEASPP
jgi:HAD superfamily hydrolase (TIGR01509 family)